VSADALELLLRALAGAWALAAALAVLVRKPRGAPQRLGAFCALGVCAFLVVSTPLTFHALGPAAFALDAWCLASPLAFWMLARALFEESFVPSAPLVLAAAIFTGVASAADWGRFALGPMGGAPAAAHALFLGLRAVSMALVAHGVYVAIAGWRGDLVDARRGVRAAFALLAGGAFGATVASSFLFPDGAPQAVRIPAMAALALATLAFLLLVASGGLGEKLREVLPPERLPAERPHAVERPDEALAQRVVEAMERHEVWRQERLTLAGLARRLEAPEYRLRRAIHHHLGHRHFSAFLAHYRLEAAAAVLADPAREAIPVIEVALECGFNSIGPFNRAFRGRFGVTPTRFRAAARARALADSCNDAAIPRIGETKRAS
jgi:AraC-like DNA-binding protein